MDVGLLIVMALLIIISWAMIVLDVLLDTEARRTRHRSYARLEPIRLAVRPARFLFQRVRPAAEFGDKVRR